MSFSALGTVTISGGSDPVAAFENAIHSWVMAGSGLAADHVIWAADATGTGPAPSGTYISMRITATDRVSSDWLMPREAGSTIRHHVRGTRHPTLELTCFAGERYGAGRAEMVLERVIAVVKLPSVARVLRDGDVGIGRRSRVRVVNGTRSGMIDPRAIVEIGLHTSIDISELGSAIETVHAQVETDSGTLDVTVTKP